MPDQAQELILTQTIHASASRVYAAFTTAEGWCSWCCEHAECAPHPGGRLHISTEGYHAYGIFKEVETDRTVTFTWDGDKEPPMLIQVTLEEHADRTLLTFQVSGLCTSTEWEGIAGTLERIWQRVLGNLREVLEG
jgi:uncharacterized protein YndB with AHSA1/START domain